MAQTESRSNWFEFVHCAIVWLDNQQWLPIRSSDRAYSFLSACWPTMSKRTPSAVPSRCSLQCPARAVRFRLLNKLPLTTHRQNSPTFHNRLTLYFWWLAQCHPGNDYPHIRHPSPTEVLSASLSVNLAVMWRNSSDKHWHQPIHTNCYSDPMTWPHAVEHWSRIWFPIRTMPKIAPCRSDAMICYLV